MLINSGRKPILTAAWKKKEVKEFYTTVGWIAVLTNCSRETWDTKARQRKNKTDYDFQKS